MRAPLPQRKQAFQKSLRQTQAKIAADNIAAFNAGQKDMIERVCPPTLGFLCRPHSTGFHSACSLFGIRSTDPDLLSPESGGHPFL